MREKETDCSLLRSVEQRAREKGLLKKGKELFCPFAQACLGTSCLLLNELEKNPRFRRIDLEQGKQPPSLSPMEKFYNRLEKTTEMRGLR